MTKPTMKMKRGISISILLILALQLALLLAGAGADDRTIRLPSDGKGVGEITSGLAAAGEGKQKPWGDCCDVPTCNRKLPPGCSCRDRVESCSSACKDCVQVSDDPPRYVCQDWYDFDLDDWNEFGIPKCKEAKQKPWGDCCDGAICNRKNPPGCTCRDKVESCSSACKDCEQVSEDPPRYVCYDWYDFDLEEAPFEIPSCKEGKQKPWGDCCDMGICNRKYPPDCTCRDKVKSCSSACKDCEQVPEFRPTRYVCRDWYHFDVEEAPFEIPRCKEAKQKPWGDCCDGAICDRKAVPACTCTDRVESCSSACKDCVQVSEDPPRYVCKDWYQFDLDDWNQFGIPKCTA